MGKTKWVKPDERKWDKVSVEDRFEKILATNGFIITGIREHLSFTEYLIQKDGIEQEYRLYLNSSTNANMHYRSFLQFYQTRVEYEAIKKATKHS